MENSSTFEVKTELFDGPIDLLLHLVKKNELPIEKLSLAFICSQYLSYLDTMRQLDLDVAGDYLVIAATLVSIKSSVLLNEPVQVVVDEDGNLVDAHEQLLERLREAAVFKEASEKLSARGVLNVDVFAPPPLLRYFETLEESFVSHDPFLLGKAFKKLLDRLPDETSFKITVDSVSITERMMKILGSLQSLG